MYVMKFTELIPMTLGCNAKDWLTELKSQINLKISYLL